METNMSAPTIESTDLNELWLDATTPDRWLPSGVNPDSGPVCLVEPHLLQKLIAAYRAAEKDAERYRWLLSHNAMPSANGDYGTPSIEFHLPEDQQGQWIARGGEDLSRVIDSMAAVIDQADK